MPKSLLDPAFKYVPAAETDLRRTFARIRREQKAIEQEKLQKVIQCPSRTRSTKTPT
jgi:hypothetical protein